MATKPDPTGLSGSSPAGDAQGPVSTKRVGTELSPAALMGRAGQGVPGCRGTPGQEVPDE